MPDLDTATDVIYIRKPLYQQLASAIDARLNCIAHCEKQPHLTEWIDRHQRRAEALAKEYLPSGSGIDCGVTIDFERSTGEKLVLNTSYHHMDQHGFYDGWTEHALTVTSSLIHTINIKISGRNRNDIKNYLHEVFDLALRVGVE